MRYNQQTNGIYERFHRTILEEFYQIAFRKKIYEYYNNERPRQGKMCCGRTLMQTWVDGKEVYREKTIGFPSENRGHEKPRPKDVVKGEAQPNLQSPLQQREGAV